MTFGHAKGGYDMYQSVKTKRTFITHENVENLRKNVAALDWAKEKADKIIADAQAYLDYGIDRIGTMFPPQEIPRCHYANRAGCPNCGREMVRKKNAFWNFDFINHPWKLICPNCGNMYPSNDFGKFYESGLDEHGLFSYDRADRSLLVNELYPDKGPDYAVDDGQGWLCDPSDPDNGRYAFIPNYAAWMVWGPRNSTDRYYGSHAVWALATAYLITGDRRYGHGAAALFYRMALLYPTLDISVYPWKAGYNYSDGLTERGRILGCIYDTVFLREAVEWYDMLFDCLDDEFAAYLREKPVRYIGETPRNGAEIRNAIEEKFLLQMYPDVRNYVIDCNPGPHHALLLKTARILQRDDLFDEYADFLFKYIDHDRPGQLRLDLESLLVSEYDRDGFAGEVSPGYNSVWFYGFTDVACLLKDHKYDMFRHPKFRKTENMVANYTTADHYTLHIADFDKCGNPGIYHERDSQVKFFLATHNALDAQLLVSIYGDNPICTDWYQDCTAVDRLIRETAQKAGPYHSQSRCLPGYGLAAIESCPEKKDPESNAVFFGKNSGHGQRDTLNLYLYGFGIDLMPDHGYASFADLNAERFRWTSNYISHNTVTPKQKKMFSQERLGGNLRLDGIAKSSKGGKIHHYDTNGKVSFISVDAENMIDHDLVNFIRDEYRRTVVTVDIDGRSRYLVDLFACGAQESHLSYHAMSMDVSCTGAEFSAQSGGTYAGADVPYADYDYSILWADGFNYLYDVRRSKSPGAFTVDWKCFDNWKVWGRERDVHLKLHILSENDEAALCTGTAPHARPGNPRELSYLVLKKTEPTAFAAVLEPYEDESFIRSCSLVRHDALVTVVCVTHVNGRVDYITVNRSGKPVEVNGKEVSGILHAECLDANKTCIAEHSYGDTVYSGTVCSFTRELCDKNYVTVGIDAFDETVSFAGKYIDISTDCEPNAFFEITSSEYLGDGNWKLGVGDCTFVTGFIDREHKEKGYTYVINEQASCTITV